MLGRMTGLEGRQEGEGPQMQRVVEWPWLCVLRPSESDRSGQLLLANVPEGFAMVTWSPAGTTSIQRLLLWDRAESVLSWSTASLQSILWKMPHLRLPGHNIRWGRPLEKTLNHLEHRPELDYDWL